MESKAEICKKLIPVLKECYNTRDVRDLKYVEDEDKVVASVVYGGVSSEVVIDVSCESGAAMVVDIMRRLM